MIIIGQRTRHVHQMQEFRNNIPSEYSNKWFKGHLQRSKTTKITMAQKKQTSANQCQMPTATSYILQLVSSKRHLCVYILNRSTDQIVLYITLQASWQQNLNLTNCKFSRKILHKHEKDVTTRKRFQVTIAIRKKL